MFSYRSAIPLFHHGIDGKSIEEYSKVSSLIAGIFNQRSPQPRYTLDAQLLIDYLKKNLSENKKLTDEQPTLKVTMLLALTSTT